MDLKMICSHWLACGWILWILFCLVVSLFERYAYPEWFTAIKSSPLDRIRGKWGSQWASSDKDSEPADEKHVRIDRCKPQDIDAIRQREIAEDAARRRHPSTTGSEAAAGASLQPGDCSPYKRSNSTSLH